MREAETGVDKPYGFCPFCHTDGVKIEKSNAEGDWAGFIVKGVHVECDFCGGKFWIIPYKEPMPIEEVNKKWEAISNPPPKYKLRKGKGKKK